jgi:RNA polymerase sigma-70 factor, ECF subfamily
VADDRARASELLGARLDHSYRIASLILRSPNDAEDAVHDAVIRAWRSHGDLRDEARFGAWFDAILLNVCRDRLRRMRTLSFVPLLDSTPAPIGAGPEASAVMRDDLNQRFSTLPFDQRAVVVLRFWDDLSVPAIAERLRIPEGTVKSRLHAATAQLRADLGAATSEGGSK